MDEFISRNSLLDTLNDNNVPYNAAVNFFIMNAPAADVAPLRHGRWVYIEYCGGKQIGACDLCGCENEMTRFCPGCGARMDGDKK